MMSAAPERTSETARHPFVDALLARLAGPSREALTFTPRGRAAIEAELARATRGSPSESTAHLDAAYAVIAHLVGQGAEAAARELIAIVAKVTSPVGASNRDYRRKVAGALGLSGPTLQAPMLAPARTNYRRTPDASDLGASIQLSRRPQKRRA